MTTAFHSHFTRRNLLRTAGLGLVGIGAAPYLAGCGKGSRAAGELPSAPDVDAAKQEGKVVLYTSIDIKALEAMNKAFHDKYGIRVEYFRGDSQDAINKLLGEGRARAVKADLIETSDSPGILYLKEQGLTSPYRSTHLEQIPDDWKDPDAHWVYTRLTLGVIAYNAARVDEPPRSWTDVASGPFRDSLAYFSDAQGSGAARLWTLAEKFGWELLEKWADARPLRVETPQLLRQTVERGERLIGLAQNDNHALSSHVDTKGGTRLVTPEEGVPLEPAAMAVVAGAPHPNSALLYYDFWLSEEGMRVLVDVGRKYVSRRGLPAPEGARPLDDLTLLPADYQKYLKKRTDVLARLADIFGGEWGQ